MSLIPSEAEIRQRNGLLMKVERGELSMHEAARQILEADPFDDLALLLMATCVYEDGRLDEARRLYRRAIEAGPCDPRGYLALAHTYTGDDGDPNLALGLIHIAARHIERFPDQFRADRDDLIAAAGMKDREDVDPEDVIGTLSKSAFGWFGEPPETAEILKPYRLILRLLDFSDGGFERKDVDEVVALGEPCVPLLAGIIRIWFRERPGISDEWSVEGALGLLGEIGSPAGFPAAMECANGFLANFQEIGVWAAHKIAARNPDLAGSVEELPAAAGDLDVYVICCGDGDSEEPDDLLPPGSEFAADE